MTMYRLSDELNAYKSEIYFLELKKDLTVGEATIPAGTPLPIDYYRLKEQVVQEREQNFTVYEFIEAMLKVLALDKEHPYREMYLKFCALCTIEVLEPVFDLAVSFKEKRDYLHALLLFKGFAQIFPDDEKVLYLYGCTMVDYSVSVSEPEKQLHLEEAAKVVFERMLRLELALPYANYQLGFLYGNQGFYDRAVSAFEMALAGDLDETMRDDILVHLPILEDKRQYQKGLNAIEKEAYREAIVLLGPLAEHYDDWWALDYALGCAYHRLGMPEEARYHLRRARNYNQLDGGILYELALLDQAEGHLKEAKDHLGKALSADPQNPLLIASFADVLNQLGENELAFKFISQGLTAFPEDAGLLLLKEQWHGKK